MENSPEILYELEDSSGYKLTVFNDRFEIYKINVNDKDKALLATNAIFTMNELVAVDMFKAKEVYDPDYIVLFTEDEDGVHKHQFALSSRGEVDKLYKILKKIVPKGPFYLFKKMFSTKKKKT